MARPLKVVVSLDALAGLLELLEATVPHIDVLPYPENPEFINSVLTEAQYYKLKELLGTFKASGVES